MPAITIGDALIGLIVIILPIAVMLFLIAFPFLRDTEAGLPGCLTGLVSFAVYVLANLDMLDEPLVSLDAILADLYFDLRPFVFGAAIGFIALFILERLSQTRIAGVVSAGVSLVGYWMLFNYLLNAKIRLTLMFVSLGIALGVLVYILTHMDDNYPEERRNAFFPF